MTGPAWDADRTADAPRMIANAAGLVASIRSTARDRPLPSLDIARQWHTVLYAGCEVPSTEYVGNYRGDPAHPDLLGYEVGTPELDAKGKNLWLGVPSSSVQSALDAFEPAFHRRLEAMDSMLVVGARPTTAEHVEHIAVTAGITHGEWIRIHPFANGNGRIARAWVNFVVARYELPSPWGVKPRPSDPTYLRAGRSSLGRPPDFRADHRPTVAVLAERLRSILESA